MNIKNIKKWAKEKIEGNVWDLLGAYLIANIVLSISLMIKIENNTQLLILLILNIIITSMFHVGLTKYMINFVKGKKHSLKHLFSKFKDYKQIIPTYLYSYLNIFLWSLLFLIPGIIKYYSYSLVPYILAENNNIKPKDALKLSKDMMSGYKFKLFLLQLSFIGWHLLSVYTLFLLELWIIPYEKTAITKFLYEIKIKKEKEMIA